MAIPQPEFEHLQRAYEIERGDRPMIVPIEMMSREELQAKAAELRQVAVR